MKEKARKIMEKRSMMIEELLETLEILGYKTNEITNNNTQPIIINKGKIVRVVETKEVKVTDDAKIKELEAKLAEYEARDEQQRQEIQRHLNRIFSLQDTVDKLNYTIGELEKTMFCDNTTEEIMEYCSECDDTTKQIKCHGTNELQCTVCNSKWEDVREEKQIKKGADKKVTKKETKVNHKVSNVNKLVKCGHDEGLNEVLFIEKRRDNKHLWYGQVRMNNEIRNFHWSNELPLPTVYGIEDMESLKQANELIKAAVKAIDPKELTRYSQVPDDIDFGACKARHFYGALHQGAYIYMSPEMQAKNPKDTDIICKGYVCDHAFIVRRDGEVYWRHYNYIFSKKPFEHTASKGYNTKQMLNDVQILFDKVEDQFAKEQSKYERKQVKKNTKEDNKDKTKEEILRDADISDLFE